VKRHRDGDGGPIFLRLHDSMAAALANRNKSVLSSIFETSVPERTRSLPNRHLDLRDKNFAVQAACDL